MRLPGFNAESALGPSRYHYRGRASHGSGVEPLAPQQYLDDAEMDLDEELDDEVEDNLVDMEDNLVDMEDNLVDMEDNLEGSDEMEV